MMPLLEIALIRYRIQMEEEKAINRFVFLHAKSLDDYSIEEIQKELALYFYETTKKEWSVSDEIVIRLIQLLRKESGV